jgi:hypothetical protein
MTARWWRPAQEFCPCGGRFGGRLDEVSLSAGDRLVTLPDVPTAVCQRCELTIFPADTLELLEELVATPVGAGGSAGEGERTDG